MLEFADGSVEARQHPIPPIARRCRREPLPQWLRGCATQTCVPVPCVFLPQQLVSELPHISGGAAIDRVPNLPECQQAMSNVGRQGEAEKRDRGREKKNKATPSPETCKERERDRVRNITCTHTHTHVHTHTHTHIHTQTNTHTHTHTHTHTRTHAPTHPPTHTHTHQQDTNDSTHRGFKEHFVQCYLYSFCKILFRSNPLI